jgi:hypothetical protein
MVDPSAVMHFWGLFPILFDELPVVVSSFRDGYSFVIHKIQRLPLCRQNMMLHFYDLLSPGAQVLSCVVPGGSRSDR